MSSLTTGTDHDSEVQRHVASLKEQDGGAIFIRGSAELARRLGEAHLIDRYNLLVFPYLLGSGKSVFTSDGRDRQSLRLVAPPATRTASSSDLRSAATLMERVVLMAHCPTATI